MVHRRDPISVLFDEPAQRLLSRAAARPGQWVQTRLADPSIRARTHAAALGFPGDLLGPDNASSSKRTLNARTAWARSFVRAVQYWHKKNGGKPRLHMEVGRHIPASPQFDPRHPERGGFPPGRAIRIKVGGVATLPASRDDAYTEAGSRAWANPERRWWDDNGIAR